jgi:hypothetical protein
MSSLAQHTIDTLTFIGPTWAPETATFPGTNMAAKFNTQGQVGYAYIDKSTSSMKILGNSGTQDFGTGPININQVNTPAEILTNFPSTYLSTFNNNFLTEAKFYFGIDPGIGFTIDSVRQKSVVAKTSLVDAWGTVVTPLITTPVQTLRYYNTRMSIDSTWVYAFGMWNFFQEAKDTSYQYSWWANGIGFPLIEADVDASDVPMNVSWLMATPAAGIDDLSSAGSLNVYPTPAQNDVTFSIANGKGVAVQLFDVTGRMIGSYPVNGDKLTISVASLANGVYTYALIDADKAIMNRGKFTVAK